MISQSIKYRPDIDGLRGIAVLIVVLYHFFPGTFTGGFIGVDIFFVISGFLITKIITTEIDQKKISLSDFYSRRIRRLLPSIILVVFSSSIIGYFFMFTEEIQNLGRHIIGAVTFTSNFVSADEVGYFDTSANLKPLIHFWSLAVEEQFYLFIPVILITCYYNRISPLIILTILFLLSAYLGVFLESTEKNRYYLPHFRFWEILSGCLLAIYSSNTKEINIPSILIINRIRKINLSILKQVTYYASIAFLLISSISIDHSDHWPRKYALLIIICTCCIILFYKNTGKISILEWRPLNHLGLISFPLYLWHWPILVYYKLIFPSDNNLGGSILILILSALLAQATYVYLEKPLFKKPISSKQISSLIGLLLTLLSIGILFHSQSEAIYRPWLETAKSQTNQLVKYFPPVNHKRTCYQSLQQGIQKLHDKTYCWTDTNSPEIAFIGDSHAMALHSSIGSGKIDKKSILIARTGCPTLVGYDQYRENKLYPRCNKWGEEVAQLIEKINTITTVIISSRGPIYIEGNGYGAEPSKGISFRNSQTGATESSKIAFKFGLSSLIKKLENLNKKVIVIIDNPELGFNPKDCLNRFGFSSNTCEFSKLDYMNRNKDYHQILKEILLDHSNIKLYSTEQHFCYDGNCSAIQNNQLLYYDDDHISIDGSRLIIKDMIDKKMF